MTIEQLLTKWVGKAGAGERAEYQQFLTEFAQALGLPTPGDAGFAAEDYRFEAPVRSEAVFGTRSTKRIDLYKRDCFVLEAKQTQLKPGETAPAEPVAPPPEPILDLFGNPVGFAAPKQPTPRYDRLMADARLQAERYALALPEQHRAPPFLLVADIGRSFELYFDWTGNGRGYAPFPDERHYRVALADLASPALLPSVKLTAADTLRAIWTDPASIDPRLRAAEVTSDIAKRLSRVAAQLEADQRQLRPGDTEIALGIEQTSLFLMRTLFCMFAEDTGLLPAGSFQTFLADAEGRSDQFWRNGLESLWSRMNDPQEVNRYWSQGDAVVRYFNGNLFAGARVYDLDAGSKRELLVAAKQDWRSVEPAIFGTLLEQVLTTADRAKLGAHYTPRAYVERLVAATITDVLAAEWEGVQAAARAILNPPPAGEGDRREAMVEGYVAASTPYPGRGVPLHHAPHGPPPPLGEELRAALHLVTGFHARLLAIRVLDPACGTGNFLYVAMEQLLRLEGEVRRFAGELGGALAPAVHPNQFLGLELNPRAGVIAELVLWIGWLRYRLANTPEAIGEPVLPPLSNINGGTHGGYDAVLARDALGQPAMPPRRPEWPEADFIVGNPPFIGGKDLRERLGGDYAEALWAANPRVPKSADFVMQWWDRAADILTRPGTRLRRFGFVTTNSITQVFSRRVIERWLAREEARLTPPPEGEGDQPQAGGGVAPDTDRPARAETYPSTTGYAGGPPPPSGEEQTGKLHLVLAIPDHPWTRVTKDAAAVRIAMTVAQRNDASGAGEGRVLTVTRERAIDTDSPVLDTAEARGVVNADLTVGTDVTRVVPLRANEGLCSPGVKLHGAGFIVTPTQAKALGLGTRPGLEAHIREYRNGRDLLQRPRGVMVIDLFGLSEHEVMDRYPEVYQHVRRTVYEKHWNPKANKGQGAWEGREINPRPSYKKYWWLFGEPRRELRPALAGLTRYITTVESAAQRVFHFVDSSVLPDNKNIVIASDDASLFGALNSTFHLNWWLSSAGMLGSYGKPAVYVKSQAFDPFPFPDHSEAVAELAERLDTTRRAAFAESASLTMTDLYNLVGEVRSGAALSPQREAEVVRARARIVAKLHDDLDRAVADAYGWGADWARAPLSPAEIVGRLVRLNAARAAEEAAGQVRWLRPDYQRGRGKGAADVVGAAPV